MTDYRWNNVGLTVPDNWEPAALERDGFLLEFDGAPACELKWRVVQGTFSFEKHIKRLAKGHKGVDMQAVPMEVTPQSWQVAASRLTESGLQLQSFIWSIHDHKGIGAALHNPATGLAALIQFFITSDDDGPVMAEVLASFRDHTLGKTVPWTMFGLSARVPSDFVLDTFSFKPGHYTVKYWRPKSARQTGRVPTGKGPGTSLTFERYAPASVLLKSVSLEEWAASGLEGGLPETVGVESDVNSLAWAGVSKTSLLRAVLRRQVHTMGHLWRPDSANAILSVRTEGVVSIDARSFNDICESYVVL